MKRLLAFGAALALMGGVAVAQTADPNAPPPPAQDNDAGPDASVQGGNAGGPAPDGMRGNWGHGGWGHHGPDGMAGQDGMRGPPWWHHGGPGMMLGGSRGAEFRFVRGRGRGAIVIRCAANDTTRECAEAVMPLLRALMPNRVMPEGDDSADQPAQ